MDDGVERRRGADGGIVERHAAHESDAAERAVDRMSETAAHAGDQDVALRPGACRNGALAATTSFILVTPCQKNACAAS